MFSRKSIATGVLVATAGILLAQTGVFCYEARMESGISKEKASDKFVNRPPRQIQEEQELNGEDLLANSGYYRMMSGNQVGQVATNGFGRFRFAARNLGPRRGNFGG